MGELTKLQKWEQSPLSARLLSEDNLEAAHSLLSQAIDPFSDEPATFSHHPADSPARRTSDLTQGTLIPSSAHEHESGRSLEPSTTSCLSMPAGAQQTIE